MNIDDEVAGRKILFRWTPKPEDRVTRYDDLGEEYLIVEIDGPGGVMIYARYRGKWDCNPSSTRNLIRRLLQIIEERRTLHDAVRKVVTQKADSVCWRDVYTELGKLVGEEVTAESLAMLPMPQMLAQCERFVKSMREGTPYERDYATERIARLEQACEVFQRNSADVTEVWEENRRLKALNEELANRVAAQSELLAKRAEK